MGKTHTIVIVGGGAGGLELATQLGTKLGKVSATVFLEGLLARWAYLSLYKMHRIALLGWLRISAEAVANMITQRTKPRVKLH